MVNLALNVSLSSLEQLLQRYTMEPTAKPFDLRSVPVQPVVEPVKHVNEMSVNVSQGQTDVIVQRENTYSGKFSR